MNATTLLREQHRRLGALIVRVSNEREARLALVLQMVEELMTHLSIEDHFFLCKVADTTSIRIEAFREEQASVRNAVLQAVFVEDHDLAFDARLRDLSTAFERYARAMERDLLPLVEDHVRADDLEAIGARMESYWRAAIDADRAPITNEVHAAE
jgi:hypothetical protein